MPLNYHRPISHKEGNLELLAIFLLSIPNLTATFKSLGELTFYKRWKSNFSINNKQSKQLLNKFSNRFIFIKRQFQIYKIVYCSTMEWQSHKVSICLISTGGYFARTEFKVNLDVIITIWVWKLVPGYGTDDQAIKSGGRMHMLSYIGIFVPLFAQYMKNAHLML